MNTIVRNPYAIQLDTTIRQRKYEGQTTHLQLEDTICLDYGAHGLPIEACRISGLPLIRTYRAGSELIHVVKGKPQSGTVSIELDGPGRHRIQREITLRLIFSYTLSRHFNRSGYNFKSVSENGCWQTDFTLSGSYTSPEGDRLIEKLEAHADRIIRSGLDIRSQLRDEAPETGIFGLYTQNWIGPHLFNTAETFTFRFMSYTILPQGMRIRYTLT